MTNKIDKYGRYIPYINLPDYSDELLSVSYVQNKLGLLFSNSSFEFKKYHITTNNFNSGQHHSGTAKIGSDKTIGLVDKNLKLFEADNIYICDTSIFPNFGNSNPGLTMMAFAIRLADHLKNIINKNDINV